MSNSYSRYQTHSTQSSTGWKHNDFSNSENAQLIRDNRNGTSFNEVIQPGMPTAGLGALHPFATTSRNAHSTSGNINPMANQQNSNSTTNGSYNAQNYTTAYSNNINSNQYECNNRFENNNGSFNGPGLFLSSAGNHGPFSDVPEDASGVWYSNNQNSNFGSFGNTVSMNTNSFNDTSTTMHTNTASQSSPESKAFHTNPSATHGTQSGSVMWSNNKNSNHFRANNHIVDNTNSFNGTGEQLTYSVNNPFAQSAASNSSAIIASYNENSNHFNYSNTMSNNKDSFNRDVTVNQQVNSGAAVNACRQLGDELDEEELLEFRLQGSLEYHHESFKLDYDMSHGSWRNDQAASDSHRIMEAIRHHPAKGCATPSIENMRTDSPYTFDWVYQELLSNS